MDFNKKNIFLFGLLMFGIIIYSIYYINDYNKVKYINDEDSVIPMMEIQKAYSPDEIKKLAYEKLNKYLKKDLKEEELFECICQKSNKYIKFLIADFDIKRFNQLRKKFVKKFRSTLINENNSKNIKNEEFKENKEFRLLQEEYKSSIIYTFMIDYEQNNIVWFSIENKKRLNYKDDKEKAKYELYTEYKKLAIEELKKSNKNISLDNYIEKIIIDDKKTIIQWLDSNEKAIYKFKINKGSKNIEQIFGL